MSRVIDTEQLVKYLLVIEAELVNPHCMIIHEGQDITIQHTGWKCKEETFDFTTIYEWLHKIGKYDIDNPNNDIGCFFDGETGKANCSRCLTPIC